MGLLAGYGLSSAIGLPFTSLEQVLPYILEGIGLDVVFILVKGARRSGINVHLLAVEQVENLTSAGYKVAMHLWSRFQCIPAGSMSSVDPPLKP